MEDAEGLHRGRPLGSDPLRDAGRSIEAALVDLRRVSSAARHGDQLAAVIVDAHAAGFRRLVELATDPATITDDPQLAEVMWVNEVAGDGAAIDTMATRVDALRSSIEQSGVPGLLDAADRLIEALTELYGWALGRALELLHESEQAPALEAAVEDGLLSALLLAHGMFPVPLAERVDHVLAACATSLGDHAGHLELVDADELAGRVEVAISGGDSTQRWRTRLTVERAIRELVPDVVDLVVVGADAEPAIGAARPPGTTLIPITAIGRRRPARWTAVPVFAALGDGDVAQVVDGGVALVACRVGRDVFVARDPFTTNSLRVVSTDPPTVEAGDGIRFAFTDPLPTHVDGDVFEVLL